VHGNGGRFAVLVPVAKLLTPQLLREDLLSALKTLGKFGFRNRQHLVVAEAIHEVYLETVYEHPVEASEVICALLKRRRMGLLEVARHRPRKVHRVLLPRSWPWRLKTEFGRGV
jgi:hypothetical protein